jgi:predicted nucleotidyltransferase
MRESITPPRRVGCAPLEGDLAAGYFDNRAMATATLPDTPMQATIDAMVRRIATQFNPVMVIVFGSYARGEAGPDSDVDLLVVLDHVDSPRRAAAAIDRALLGRTLPINVIVTTPERMQRLRDLVGTVVYPAVREGVVAYERAAARTPTSSSAVRTGLPLG